jgi:hypothetical protein
MRAAILHPGERIVGRARGSMLAAVLVLGAAACGSDPAGTAEPVVRDSAGIAIVENPASLADRPYERTLSAEPILDIGVIEGQPEYQLFRVSSAQLLPDGSLVIANAGTQELRLFDGTGRFLAAVGGRGDGPGEYQHPVLVPSPHADTILVHDGFVQRLTVLSADGELIRTEMTGGTPGGVVGSVTGQRLVATSNTASVRLDSPEGIVTNEVVVRVALPGSAEADTVARVAGPDLFVWNQSGRVGFTQVPFDARPTVATGGDWIHIALGRIPEVRTFDAEGRLLRVVRIVRPADMLTRAEFDAYVEERVARARDASEAAELRRQYAATPVRDALPANQRVLVDARDNVWVERFPRNPDDPPTWMILGTDGIARGTIVLPAGVRVLTIGEDRVVGLLRDAMDVEHVLAWRLVPTG